jgi:hypothetical protein
MERQYVGIDLHRRTGDRQANSALWRIVMVRMANDPRTQAYDERSTKEGRTKKEIIRCLKRYFARERVLSLPTARNHHLTTLGASLRRPRPAHGMEICGPTRVPPWRAIIAAVTSSSGAPTTVWMYSPISAKSSSTPPGITWMRTRSGSSARLA